MRKLLERSAALDILRGASERTLAGHGGTVLIEGEAGVGKTTLLQAFAEANASDFHISWGWCEALFTPRPLGPLHDIAHSLGPEVEALLEQSVSPDRLFPAVLNRLQDGDGRPQLLILEDLHWADNATLDLVKYLGRRIALLPVMVVLTARSDEIGTNNPLSYVLGDLPSAAVSRIKLGPLSPAAVQELALEAGRVSDSLYRVTAGNPFFVTELLAAGPEDTGDVPDSIRDAVWSRLSRLTPGERDVLEMISIVPGTVELGLINALLDGAENPVDMAVSRGLLRRDERGDISFRHELARQATLDRLSSSLQRSLHSKVEAALATLPGQDSMLHLARRVHHAAGAQDGARVLELAPRAAERASLLGAHQQAASFLATALDYVDEAEPALAAQLHESWAYEASLGLYDYGDIIKSHHRAIAIWRELGNGAKVSLNYRLLSRLHWRRGEGDEARNFADLAVEEVEGTGPGPELAMAYSTRSQLNMLHYRFADAIEWGWRAIRLADELGVVETRVHALNNVGTAMLFDGQPGGREVMEEGLALALEHGFHDHAARAYTNFAEYAVVFKDFELAERLLAEGIAFAARHDLDSSTQYLLGRQAQLRMEQGRLHEAETIAEGVIGMERLPVVMHLPALTVLGRVQMRMSQPGGQQALERALAEGLPTGEPQRIFPVRIALVEAAWLKQDLEAARAQLTALGEIELTGLREWDFGELAAWWRRCEMAEPLPVRPRNLPRAWGLELEGRPAEAAEEWTRLGLPYEAGIALLQVEDDAAAAVVQAMSIFEAIEARQAMLLARGRAQLLGVAQDLPRLRRGPYASARQHPMGLTASEQQVLRLIAEGRSNKDIARQLSRSPRTIEHQVSAVLGKFSAANRIEVMLRLRTEPWLLTPAEDA